ncbi:DUF488 domain-containing protein [Botrimarina colliarenosi]|nr:DUF488 family protein [Botrimarina colliarenosi]
MRDTTGVRIARVYDAYQASDGYRVLVDRLWPRGVSRAAARIDDWAKNLAPSASLRRWFGHEPARFEAFRRFYIEELLSNPAAEEDRRRVLAHPMVTLLYAASTTKHNHAIVLREFLIRGGATAES